MAVCIDLIYILLMSVTLRWLTANKISTEVCSLCLFFSVMSYLHHQAKMAAGTKVVPVESITEDYNFFFLIKKFILTTGGIVLEDKPRNVFAALRTCQFFYHLF